LVSAPATPLCDQYREGERQECVADEHRLWSMGPAGISLAARAVCCCSTRSITAEFGVLSAEFPLTVDRIA
jgi:hypothetical protein